MAAFWALFNNVFELRTDAFKISKISQRIFAEPSQGIGAWQVRNVQFGSAKNNVIPVAEFILETGNSSLKTRLNVNLGTQKIFLNFLLLYTPSCFFPLTTFTFDCVSNGKLDLLPCLNANLGRVFLSLKLFSVARRTQNARILKQKLFLRHLLNLLHSLYHVILYAVFIQYFYFQAAFEIMGILAVMTNCALLAMSPAVQNWFPSDFTTLNYIVVFIVAEVRYPCS